MKSKGLTDADEQKLVGVNPQLVALVRLVAAETPLQVIEGVRTMKRQRELFNARKSKTLQSKHLVGRAVDIAPLVGGVVSWDWVHYRSLVRCAKRQAALVGLPMEFGYDWGWDAPHWEMRNG